MCEKNCPFTMYASFDNATKRYQMKTFQPIHTCSVVFKNRRVIVKWLAVNYLHKYKCIHAMRLVDLKDLVREDIKVDVTLSQLRRAKLLTMAKLQGDLEEEYGRL